MRVKGLLPIYNEKSKVLILGTIPSAKSREKQEYYADNRNRFWKVFCDCNNVSIPQKYEDKVKLLNQNCIALWDLIESCEIQGSKDSSIKNPQFNALAKFLEKTKIDLIVFNGQKAFELYKKHFKELNINYFVAPNTSSVNGSFDIDLWKISFDSPFVPYVKAVHRYIQLCGNNTIYKLNGNNIVLDKEYAFPRACVDCGITVQQNRLLEKAIIRHIKIEKL